MNQISKNMGSLFQHKHRFLGKGKSNHWQSYLQKAVLKVSR